MVCNEIFASLHSNAVRRSALRRLYKCGFRRRMSNGSTESAPLYQTSVHACVYAISAGTEFLFNSRESNYRIVPPCLCIATPSPIPHPPPPFYKIALTFITDHRRGRIFRCFLRIFFFLTRGRFAL